MIFDTKIAVVVREDLAIWQKLNVTAFVSSAIIGANPQLIGEPYEDASGRTYLPMLIQPVLVYSATADQIRTVYERAVRREARFAVYTEGLFKTGNDVENRATVKVVGSDDLRLVGLGLREDKKTVDKIISGLKFHA